MDLYLAGLPSSQRMMDFVKEFNKDLPFEEKIGVMCTFANPKAFHKCVENGFEKIFLDSGAFTAFNSGKEINIDELIAFIKKHKEQITHYIALDVIPSSSGDAAIEAGWQSVRNREYMKEQGLDPMPVYHAGEPWEIVERYCSESEYVCLGGMAGVSSDWLSWFPYLSQLFLQFPNHKFHALGVNDPRLAQRFPFFSVDALTWRSGSRFGQVITPWGRWWISSRNAKSVSKDDLEKTGVLDWLTEKGIPFPLPEGYDFNLLDELNIRTLYDEIVKTHREDGSLEVSFPISIF